MKPEERKSLREEWKARCASIGTSNCLLIAGKNFTPLPDLSPVPVPAWEEQKNALRKHVYGESSALVLSAKVWDMIPWTRTKTPDWKKLKTPNGLYFRINPVLKTSGKTITSADVDDQFALVEMDNPSYEAQERLWSALIRGGFPVVSLTSSGGRSIHALLRFEASSRRGLTGGILMERRTARREKYRALMALLAPFAVDRSVSDATRFSRWPGIMRGERKQELLYLNPAADVWTPEHPGNRVLADADVVCDPIPANPSRRSGVQWTNAEPGSAEEQRVFRENLKTITGGRELDLFGFCDDAGWAVDEAEEQEVEVNGKANRKLYITCPWGCDHSGGVCNPKDSYVFERSGSDGRPGKFLFGFHCSHDSCRDTPGKGILDLLFAAREDYPDLFEARLAAQEDLSELLPELDDPEEAPEPSEPAEALPVIERPPLPDLSARDLGDRARLLLHLPNDEDNAAILERLHGWRMRYVATEKKWFIWNGIIWEADKTKQSLYLAMSVSLARQQAIGKLKQDEDTAKMLVKAKGAGSDTSLKAMLSILSALPGIATAPDAFGSNPGLLACLDGIINLQTTTLRAATPADMITLQCPRHFTPGAPTPLLDGFTLSIFPEHPGRRELAMRWCGYCMSGWTEEQKMMIFFGNSGRNGKGILCRLVEECLGPMACSKTRGFFSAKAKQQDENGHNTAIADLEHKRATFVSELNMDEKADSAKIKSFTGGDRIEVRRAHATESRSITLESKFTLLTNQKLRFPDTDSAIWTRIILLEFPVSFADDPDTTLEARLHTEIDAIFSRFVLEAGEWYRTRDLRIPPDVEASAKAYRNDEDILGAFVPDCLMEVEDGFITRRDMRAAFEDWREDMGAPRMSPQALFAYLTSRGIHESKVHGGIRGFKGYRLANTGSSLPD